MSTDVSQIITESSTLAIGFTLLSLALTLVITLLVLRFVRKALGQDRSIVQNGIPARAKILSVQQTGLMLNNQPQVEFQLEVYPPTGMPYQAQAKAIIGLVSIPQFQPGVEIPVKIHPTDLSKVALVPQV
jgi:competence protein ComGC